MLEKIHKCIKFCISEKWVWGVRDGTLADCRLYIINIHICEAYKAKIVNDALTQ